MAILKKVNYYNSDEKLMINLPQTAQHAGIKNDQVGPGHYEH